MSTNNMEYSTPTVTVMGSLAELTQGAQNGASGGGSKEGSYES